jgi:ABC-type multidrug transport system ATPase subunit
MSLIDAPAPLVAAASASIELRDGSRLLDHVTLDVHAGEVIAIVGPSGSGKTTLLEALAGVRVPTSGRIETAEHDRPMGYVPQEDIVHRELTVASTVRYAARLRLPSGTSRDEIESTVARTLALLGLTERRDLAVGALSGGQRKRVSIATELVVRPGVCFLDEPTAGLDPTSAAALVEALRSLADHGTSIVMTTHNLADLRVADRLVVVGTGGRVVFDGAPHEAPRHLVGFAGDAPRDRLPVLRDVRTARPEPDPFGVITSGRHTWWEQTRILTRRNLDLMVRNRMSMAIMTGSPLLVVAMFSVLFPPHAFDAGHRDAPTMLSVTYWLAFAGFFFGLTFGLLQICTELAIVRRERLVTIDVGPYLIAKAAVLLPVLGAVDALMIATLRWLDRLPATGLSDATTLWALLGVDALAGLALGLLASASVSNAAQAALALPMLCFPAVLFSGAILPVASMTNVGTAIASVISDRWAFEALARSLAVAGAGETANPAIAIHRGALSGPLGGHVLIIVGLAAAFLFAGHAVLARRTRSAGSARGRSGEGGLRTVEPLPMHIRQHLRRNES